MSRKEALTLMGLSAKGRRQRARPARDTADARLAPSSAVCGSTSGAPAPCPGGEEAREGGEWGA